MAAGAVAVALVGCSLLAPSAADIVGGDAPGNDAGGIDAAPGIDAEKPVLDAQTNDVVDGGAPSEVVQLSSGSDHYCALRADGTVWCWGSNSHGELGDGTRAASATPTKVDLPEPVAEVLAGRQRTCVRFKSSGNVTCWGDAANGGLGSGATADQTKPTGAVVNLGGKAAVALSGRGSHLCARLSDGTAKCWGANRNGELGIAPGPDEPLPVDLPLQSPITDIVTGTEFTCARHGAGEYRCFGANDLGQLGTGRDAGAGNPLPGSNVAKIHLGRSHGCAVMSGTGTIKCWGSNVSGCVGTGASSDAPVPVPQDIPIPAGDSVAGMALGSTHSCALLTNGGVRCWGDNSFGKLGDGTSTLAPQRSPSSKVDFVQPAIGLVAGNEHTCAHLADKSVWCWGNNRYGAIGTGTLGTSPLPAIVAQPQDAGAPTDLSAGDTHTCVRFNTRWSCVGNNASGQLGLGDTVTRGSFGPPTLSYRKVSGGTGTTCGYESPAGPVYCWGDNRDGQLGVGGGPSDPLPKLLLLGPEPVNSLSVGSNHACVSMGDAGSVKCWGNNETGQLGNATQTTENSPISISSNLPAVKQVIAGNGRTCALLNNRSAKCWGSNRFGELGLGDRAPRNAPPSGAVAVDAGVLQLALGGNHTCARLADKTVRCWGVQANVGIPGLTSDQLQPPAQAVQLPAAPVEVAAGRGATCSIVEGGAVFCWGENSTHQLGQGPEDTTDRTTPVKVNLPAPAAQITAGGSHFCTLLTNGSIACWGLGTSGQLGLGDGPLNRGKPSRVLGL